VSTLRASRRSQVRQLAGAEEIERALADERDLGLILVQDTETDRAVVDLVERASARGIPIRRATEAVLRRMTSTGPAASVLALEGRSPTASLEHVLELRGALWMLVGIAYPTNAGVAIRTAEGSGADGIVVDAPDWDHVGRRAALRASMRADWYMPVFWERAEPTLARARAAGRKLYAIENTGTVEPWEVDLSLPSVFVIGGEAHGIPPAVLAGCDAVLRVPMAGFIPSYNLQIAVGVVATERLRQLALRP